MMLSASAGFHRGRARVCWSSDTANPSRQDASVCTAIACVEVIVFRLSVHMFLGVLLLWVHSATLTCQRADSTATENLSLTDSDLPAGHSRRRPRYALATSLFSCSQPERGSSHIVVQSFESPHSSY